MNTPLGKVVLIAVLFAVYLIGIGSNPPGFYVDESGLSYNAYMVSQTGAGEFPPSFPLYFQLYTGGFTQYSNPIPIYLLSALFFVTGPSILAARVLTSAASFLAGILLGFLAGKITNRRSVAVIITIISLAMPWTFEIGRLVMDHFFFPLSIVLFLLAAYYASRRHKWSWGNVAAIVLTLMLVTYSYTIGRLVGPMLAFGLIFLAIDRARVLGVAKAWVAYAATMVPLLVYIKQNPGLTTRFSLISYIKPQSTWSEIASGFVSRYLQDLSLTTLLFRGDLNPRHHIPDAYGSLYFVAVGLAVLGIIIAIIRCWRDPWWRFALWGLLAAFVPGAMTVDAHHTLRMAAVPIYLCLFMIPAVECLLGKRKAKALTGEAAESETPTQENRGFAGAKQAILAALMIGLFCEAAYFHKQYYQRGSARGYVFDAAYKEIYDIAVARPERPIYLVDGYWGPAYVHAFWYAALEGRNKDEFVHQPYGVPPPEGSLVIRSDRNCTSCQMIETRIEYMLYKALPSQ